MSEKSPSVKNSFSKRQLEILDLVSQGKTNKEIAIDLKIAYGTVKQHLFTIFRMMGVSNRGKVAIAAKRVLDSQEGEKKLRYGALNKKNYSWRLVSAVILSNPLEELKDPVEIIKRNQYLILAREWITRQTIALDGKCIALPDGGMLAWFGYPIAHLDDSDRATQLARLVQWWLKQEQNQIRLGIGVATHAEVVPSGLSDLYAADAYRIAQNLAEQSVGLNLPLANSLTYQLSANNVPWLVLKPQIKSIKNGIENKKSASANQFAIGPLQPMHNYSQGNWGALPFLKEVGESAQRRIAQWLAVESWPPSLAFSLLNAIGYETQKMGFEVLHWRMPISRNTDSVIGSLLTQMEANFPQLNLSTVGYAVSGGERLAGALAKLTEKGPLLLQVYGIQALQNLKKILGDKGIDRLVSLPLVIVAADLQDLNEDQPERAPRVKVLGPRPNNPLLSRIFTMKPPEMQILPEGIRLDLQALMDDLTDVAQQFIIHAALHPNLPMEEIISELKAPRPVIQMAIRELITIGLIAPSQNSGFEFRDAWIAKAIRQMNDASLMN